MNLSISHNYFFDSSSFCGQDANGVYGGLDDNDRDDHDDHDDHA